MSNLSAYDCLFDRFEELWGKVPAPPIEDILSSVPESDRPKVFQALLEIEVELRAVDFVLPEKAECLRRFSDLTQEIDAAFVIVTRRLHQNVISIEEVQSKPVVQAEIPKDLVSNRVFMGPFRLRQFIKGGGRGTFIWPNRRSLFSAKWPSRSFSQNDLQR